MLSNCGAGEDYWESFDQQGNQTSQSKRESTLNIHWKDDVEAEAPMLWPPHVNSQLIGKDPDPRKVWGQEEKGGTEDNIVGWHHQLNGHEFEQIPEDGEGQESLTCCSPWSHRVGHNFMTEQQQKIILLDMHCQQSFENGKGEFYLFDSERKRSLLIHMEEWDQFSFEVSWHKMY